MSIQYSIKREVFMCPQSDLNGVWTKFRRDAADNLFQDMAYDAIKSMSWLDTKAGHRAKNRADSISRTMENVKVAKGRTVEHKMEIGDYRLILTIIN